jgi:hypothetical protein
MTTQTTPEEREKFGALMKEFLSHIKRSELWIDELDLQCALDRMPTNGDADDR